MNVFDAKTVAAQKAEVPGVSLQWVLSKNVGAPNFSLRIVNVEPDSATERHQHDWEHEVYVLEGQGEVYINGQTASLAPETCVYVAPNELHQFSNISNKLLRFICVVPNR